MSDNAVDLFGDLATASDASVPEPTTPDAEAQSTPDQTDTPDSPAVETVSEVPADAVSVTAFAQYLTQLLTKKTLLEDGGDLDGSEYIVPQNVYQTVKAQKDRIPHVLVKESGDTEARVYILKTPATEWWLARRERLASRAGGAGPASNRTPEQNLTLLSAAQEKFLYAQDRAKLWAGRVDDAQRLVEKYKGFLKDANVSEETVALAIQEASDAYATEQAAKAAEKAKNSKKASAEAPAEAEPAPAVA